MHLKPRLLWKTLLLYIVLLCGILTNSTLIVHAAEPTPQNIEIQNPLGTQQMTIIDLIERITSQLTPLALVIATFSIIVVGFQFVIAAVQGNTSKIAEARKNLMWVLIGTAIVVAATVIATAVKTFLTGLNQ